MMVKMDIVTLLVNNYKIVPISFRNNQAKFKMNRTILIMKDGQTDPILPSSLPH